MDPDDRRHVVLIGTVQTMVIVGGVLGCAIALRANPDAGGLTRLFRDLGVVLLIVPLAWALVAPVCFRRVDASSRGRLAVEVVGVALVLALLGLVSVAVIVPLVGLFREG
jgi:hypothetical protein